MSLKFKDEIDFATFDNLMEENANVFLSYDVWLLRVENKLLGFGIFFFPLKNKMKNNSLNRFFKMLDLGLRPRVLSVIIICILWLNLKKNLLIKGLKRIAV
jgi:hypothetical protein